MRPPKIIFAATLLLGACLGNYTPPKGSSNSPATPTPPSGSPSGVDPAPPTPPASVDAGAPKPPPSPPPPASPPDGGVPGVGAPLTGDCATLSDCCDLLPPDQADLCNSALQNATPDVCTSILGQLEQDGYCP